VDHDHAREAGTAPLGIELVAVLLQDAVVAVLRAELALVAVRAVLGKALQVARRQRRVGWRLAPRKDFALKVAVEDRQRVARIRMALPSFRQHEDGAQIHRPAPELREALALDADSLYVAGVG